MYILLACLETGPACLLACLESGPVPAYSHALEETGPVPAYSHALEGRSGPRNLRKYRVLAHAPPQLYVGVFCSF